jgi:hypothetical protein
MMVEVRIAVPEIREPVPGFSPWSRAAGSVEPDPFGRE